MASVAFDSIFKSFGSTKVLHGISLDISDGVRAAVAEIDKGLPEGVHIRVTSDESTFIGGALRRGPLKRHLRQCDPCRAFSVAVPK